MPSKQFLVTVEPSPEGYEARVQPVLEPWFDTMDGPEFAGQGATELAACLSALTNARLGEPVAKVQAVERRPHEVVLQREHVLPDPMEPHVIQTVAEVNDQEVGLQVYWPPSNPEPMWWVAQRGGAGWMKRDALVRLRNAIDFVLATHPSPESKAVSE